MTALRPLAGAAESCIPVRTTPLALRANPCDSYRWVLRHEYINVTANSLGPGPVKSNETVGVRIY
jgi:hypothetical protein